jgi:hypothetical protein
MSIFILLSGLLNLFMAVAMSTENFKSTVIFKVIPFFIGLGAVIFYLDSVNII